MPVADRASDRPHQLGQCVVQRTIFRGQLERTGSQDLGGLGAPLRGDIGGAVFAASTRSLGLAAGRRAVRRVRTDLFLTGHTVFPRVSVPAACRT